MTSLNVDGSTIEHVIAGNTIRVAAAGVGSSHLADAAVTTAKLADDAVTAAKLADDAATDANRAVTTNHIRDAAVTTAKLADDAVTAAKLADDAATDANRAVTTNHIRDAAVTTAKLADGAATTAKLADGAATGAKLGSDVATLTGAQTLSNKTFSDSITVSAGINVGTATAAGTGQVKASASVLASQPMARVYHNAAQTLTSGVVLYSLFNTERYDTNGIHSVVSNTERLTCVTAGKYRITGNVEIAFHATGARILRIRLNGTTIIAEVATDANANSSQPTELLASTTYALGVNDYVELGVYQNSGGDLNLNSASAYSPEFMMEYVGD